MDQQYRKFIRTCYFIFLISSQVTDVQLLLTIEREPQNISLMKGTSGTLECVGHSSTNHNANYRCSWLRDGSVMFVGEGKRRLFYDWLTDYHLGNCTIILKNADLQRHQGKWVCTVINTELDETVTSRSATVTVLVAPTAPEIQDSSGNELAELTIVEGKVQQLHCISRKGNPAPILHWMRNIDDISMMATYYNNSESYASAIGTALDEGGTRTSHDGSNPKLYTAGSWLSLTANRSHDGSVVSCYGQHPGYDPEEEYAQSTSVTINVIYPPQNLTNDSNVTIIMNDEGAVELDCPLEGKPEPEYSWFWIDDYGHQTYQIGWQKQIVLDNLSNDQIEGGYYCKAFAVMGDQNLTAFSSMFVLSPPVFYDEYECSNSMVVLIITTVLGTFAFASFLLEILLIIYFKCKPSQPSDRIGLTQSLFHELYNTRGRKMALVHVRAEHDDKGASGWTLHVSSSFVSIILVILSIFTMATYVVSIFFCYVQDSCDCTFLHPAVMLTIVFGGIVIVLQFIFFMGFCMRKLEERKYKTYARKREDVAGYIATESPTKQSVIITPSASRPNSSKSTEQNGKINGKNDDLLPGSVAV